MDGKTLMSNASEVIEDHGINAYPFSPEKLAELKETEKAKLDAQTLESLLVSRDRDFVIGKDGVRVPVANLVGKHILLYFSTQWCPPCRTFLPKLITAYHEIKAKDNAFEVVFVSSDSSQASFDEFFGEMPWLAIPLGDERKVSLSRTFKILGIPSLIVIEPTGKTITKEAVDQCEEDLVRLLLMAWHLALAVPLHIGLWMLRWAHAPFSIKQWSLKSSLLQHLSQTGQVDPMHVAVTQSFPRLCEQLWKRD